MTGERGHVVAIDYLPESARRYGEGWAIVGIDIMRATTTAVTIANSGRRCLPVPSVEVALELAERHPQALLVGEVGGKLPSQFHLQNSPVVMEHREDVERPAILLSSSGTRIFHEVNGASAMYAACLRNTRAQAEYLASRHDRVALIGAGTKGEFRREDQFGCAKIAEKLIAMGFVPANESTRDVITRWHDAPVATCGDGRSAEYLRRTDQMEDLDFVLTRIDDISEVFRFTAGEIVRADP